MWRRWELDFNSRHTHSGSTTAIISSFSSYTGIFTMLTKCHTHQRRSKITQGISSAGMPSGSLNSECVTDTPTSKTLHSAALSGLRGRSRCWWLIFVICFVHLYTLYTIIRKRLWFISDFFFSSFLCTAGFFHDNLSSVFLYICLCVCVCLIRRPLGFVNPNNFLAFICSLPFSLLFTDTLKNISNSFQPDGLYNSVSSLPVDGL